jgi:hypothetical protein
MNWFVIAAAALVASGLTLFSGFGLGTLLMPVFAIFFPLDLAVALTGVVHLANNLFKLALMGKHADKGVVARFGLPAVVAAVVGAWLLSWLSTVPPWIEYALGDHNCRVTIIKLLVAGLMIAFALMELLPWFEKLSFGRRYLPLGGALSGFFGGLLGHQGALRSAFLLQCGLSKEEFIGTGVVIACVVDVTRLSVYAGHFATVGVADNVLVLVVASAAAFVGALAGRRLLKKVKLRAIQVLVAVMLLGIAVALAAGVI